jgi:hypothetical protein
VGFKFDARIDRIKINDREVTGWRKHALAAFLSIPSVLISLGVVFLALAFVVALLALVLGLLAIC